MMCGLYLRQRRRWVGYVHVRFFSLPKTKGKIRFPPEFQNHISSNAELNVRHNRRTFMRPLKIIGIFLAALAFLVAVVSIAVVIWFHGGRGVPQIAFDSLLWM